MKNNVTAAVVLCIIALAIWSCKKDNDTDTTGGGGGGGSNNQTTYTGPTDYFTKNAVPFQTFTVNGTSGGIFTGSNGTKFTIPTAAFVNANNQPVTAMVTIKIKEVYEKSQMFFSNIPTTSFGSPLISAGMYYFEPSFNGDKLKFAPGKKLNAELPADSIDFDMMPFNGQVGFLDLNGDGIADGPEQVNWVPNDSLGGMGGATISYDNTVPFNYLYIDDSTGWHNVDAFYSSPSDISITVNTLNNPNPDSTFAFVWFTGFNSFWHLQHSTINNLVFESSHVKPVAASLIAITFTNNKIYADIKTLGALTANGVYDLNMHEVTDTELKNLILALN